MRSFRSLALTFCALVATLSLSGAAAATQLSCDVSLSILNSGQQPISVALDSVEIRSEQYPVGWLPWRRASSGGWFDADTSPNRRLHPGQSLGDIYRPGGACIGAREVRFRYTCLGGFNAGQTYRPQSHHRDISIVANRTIVIRVGDICGAATPNPDSFSQGGTIPNLPGIGQGN
jgi:hypothetical protein